MTCEWIKLPDGTPAVICGPRPRRRQQCSVCRQPVATRLCDYPVQWRERYGKRRTRKTCDRPLCQSCAVHGEGDTDYCPSHPPSGRQLGLAL